MGLLNHLTPLVGGMESIFSALGQAPRQEICFLEGVNLVNLLEAKVCLFSLNQQYVFVRLN